MYPNECDHHRRGDELRESPTAKPQICLPVTLEATSKEFLGLTATGNQQIPKFRLRSANRNANLPAGHSLLFGMAQTDTSSDASASKQTLVLVTPTFIDAAGNRLGPQ